MVSPSKNDEAGRDGESTTGAHPPGKSEPQRESGGKPQKNNMISNMYLGLRKRPLKRKKVEVDASLNVPSRAHATRVDVDDLAQDHLIIAVMGPTGSGKSSFINTVTGYQQGVGHTLESCTSEISVVKFSFPELVSIDICFVDTPGFDDTNKPDTEIFKMISNWLNQTYQKNIKLSGLLYFHRISDNRMAGTPLKNLRMFEELVGKQFHNIILTTTMWDEVDGEDGSVREAELRNVYWRSLIDRGSTTARFEQTTQSAFQLLAPLLDQVNRRETLLLQKEVTDLGLELRQTSAGQKLFLELEHLVKRQQEMLERIRVEMKKSDSDQEELQALMEEYQKITGKLASTSEQMNEMKIDIGARLGRAVKVVFMWHFFKGLFKAKPARTASLSTEPQPDGHRTPIAAPL